MIRTQLPVVFLYVIFGMRRPCSPCEKRLGNVYSYLRYNNIFPEKCLLEKIDLSVIYKCNEKTISGWKSNVQYNNNNNNSCQRVLLRTEAILKTFTLLERSVEEELSNVSKCRVNDAYAVE